MTTTEKNRQRAEAAKSLRLLFPYLTSASSHNVVDTYHEHDVVRGVSPRFTDDVVLVLDNYNRQVTEAKLARLLLERLIVDSESDILLVEPPKSSNQGVLTAVVEGVEYIISHDDWSTLWRVHEGGVMTNLLTRA